MKISGGNVRPDDDLTRPASGPGELPAFTGPVLAPTAPHEEEVVMTLPEMQAVACPNPAQANVGGTIRRGAILALDLGTSAGWALQSSDGHISTGTVSLKHTRYDGGGMRYLRFRRWLTELKQCATTIDQLVFEEVRRHASTDAAHAYGGFLATLTAWCEHHGVPYQGVPVGTIKKHATGRGNASKDEVIAAMRKLGYRPADDNEADALAILHWALGCCDVEREV